MNGRNTRNQTRGGSTQHKAYYSTKSESGISQNTERTICTFPVSGYCVIGIYMTSTAGFVSVNVRIDGTYLVRGVDPEGGTGSVYTVIWSGNVTAGQKLYIRCQNESNRGTYYYNCRAAVMPVYDTM